MPRYFPVAVLYFVRCFRNRLEHKRQCNGKHSRFICPRGMINNIVGLSQFHSLLFRLCVDATSDSPGIKDVNILFASCPLSRATEIATYFESGAYARHVLEWCCNSSDWSKHSILTSEESMNVEFVHPGRNGTAPTMGLRGAWLRKSFFLCVSFGTSFGRSAEARVDAQFSCTGFRPH